MMRQNFAACLLLASTSLWADDSTGVDLDALLNKSAGPDYTTSTFKGTQVIFSPTVEQNAQGNMQFLISHRFGGILNSGYDGFYGMDNAKIRIALDYGITDWFDLGLARDNDGLKPVELDGKFKLLRQRNDGGMPVSVSLNEQYFYGTTPDADLPFSRDFFQRSSAVNELLIARKFSPNFSAQLLAGAVWRDVTPSSLDWNWTPVAGLALRYKFTNRFAWTADALGPIPGTVAARYLPAMGTGIEMETGGHVFQVYIANSQYISGDLVSTQTYSEYQGNFDFHIGFHISRAFSIYQ